MHELIKSLCILIFFKFYTTAQYRTDVCLTPNKEVASCVSLIECPVLYQAFATYKLSYGRKKNQKLFLKNSICGGHDTNRSRSLLVCCGSMPNYKTSLKVPTSKTRPKPSENTLSSKELAHLEKLLPSRDVCGRSEDADRILGGTEARLGDYPWMVQLLYRVKPPFVHRVCGGSLISKNYVITAAHCIVDKKRYLIKKKVYFVRLGEHDETREIDCYVDQGCNDKVVDVLVAEAIAHKGYLARGNEGKMQDDIALLRLVKKIDYTEFINPICLPIYGETVRTGQKVITAGWGSIHPGGKVQSTIKKKVSGTILDQSKCFAILMKKSKVPLTNKQICVAGEAGRGSCKGDSGGPLMALLPRSHLWYLEGLVSFGLGKCGREGIPKVYTKVSAYLNWISHHIRP